MVSNWPVHPLEDLVEEIIDRRGMTPYKLGGEFTDQGHRVISAKLIKKKRIDLAADEPRFVNTPTYRRWMHTPLLAGDVILTSEAPLGETAYIEHELDWCLGQRLFALRARKGLLHGRFLYYALQSAPVQHDLQSRATGTTALGIRQSELRKVRIPVPGMRVQRAIAHILGTLDDKIALNRRMNATLEGIAQAIFKSWFVDFDPVRAKAEGRDPGLPKHLADIFPDRFVDSELGEIPEGWRVGTLGDIAVNERRGVSPVEINPQTPYIALEHMPQQSVALANWSSADDIQSSKLCFRRGEVLFGKLRPYFHKVGVAPVDGVCSTDIVVLRPKRPGWFAFLLCHVSSTTFIEYTVACSTGTKMPRTNWNDMSQYPVALPALPLPEAFASYVRPIADMIIDRIHECRSLASIRDTLLPKLISGELGVPDAEHIVGEHT